VAASATTERQKRLTLLAAILASSIALLDGTVVNVALPAIREDLDAGLATQQWVVEAYLLMLGSLLLIGGSLSDVYGRRRVFAAGAAGFGLTSLVCAAAPTGPLLIAARGLQGAAGALLVPSALAVIVATFDDRERAAAIGAWTAWSGVAALVGPLLGGVLVDSASWRLVFAINVAPVVLTLYLVARHVSPGLDRTTPRHVDLPGAVLCALGLSGLVLGLIEQPARGFGDPLVAVPVAVGAAALAAFLAYERRSRDPMLPLELFRRRNFAVGNAATLVVYAGLGAATFFLPVYLQQVAGYGAVEAGLTLMPVTVIVFLLARRFGALADRYGPRLFMGAGPVVAAAGLFLMLRIDSSPSYVADVLSAGAVFGLGLSITVAPLTAAVLADADHEHAGVASGVNNAIARVAGLVAIAAVGALLSATFESALDDDLSGAPLSPAARAAVRDARDRPLSVDVGPRVRGEERARVADAVEDASVDGFRAGMAAAALLTLAGGLVAAAGIRNPRREVPCEGCPGGALVGASRDLAARPDEPVPVPAAAPG
jgi:EmrB/QacA subfamily drug resistance transporter